MSSSNVSPTSTSVRHTNCRRISAVVFGAAHYQGQWQNGLLLSLVMVFIGLGLAFIYERRGNIVANMAAHATFNVIGFIFILTTLNH